MYVLEYMLPYVCKDGGPPYPLENQYGLMCMGAIGQFFP